MEKHNCFRRWLEKGIWFKRAGKMKLKWQDKAAGHPRGEGQDETDGRRAWIIDWNLHQKVVFAFSYLGRERTNEKWTELLSSFIIALEWIIRQLGLLKVGKAWSPEDLTCASDFRGGWWGKQAKAFGERFDGALWWVLKAEPGSGTPYPAASRTKGGSRDLAHKKELIWRWTVLRTATRSEIMSEGHQ